MRAPARIGALCEGVGRRTVPGETGEAALRFTAVRLKGFRPYRDDARVTFPKAAGNIHLIQGRNGMGKTSLHEALLWAFHAPNEMGGGRTQYKRMNQTARTTDDTPETSVTVKFTHNDTDYQIVREASTVGRRRATTNLTLFRDGVPVTGDTEDPQEVLDNLLPKRASEFLFFDGEKMENLAQQMNGEKEGTEVRNQIELLLGLKVVQHLTKDLRDVQRTVEDELDAERQKQSDRSDLADTLEAKKDDRDALTEEINELTSEIEQVTEQKQQVKTKLEELSDETIETIRELEREIEHLEDDRIPAKRDEYDKLIQDAYVFVLADDIEVAIETFSQRYDDLDEQLTAVTMETARYDFITDSLHADVCQVCERTLDTTAEQTLIDKKNELQIDGSQRETLEQERFTLDQRLETLKASWKVVEQSSPADIKQKLDRLRDQLEEKRAERDRLQSQLTTGVDERSKWEQERDELDTRLTQLRTKRDDRREQRADLDAEIAEIRDELEDLETRDFTESLRKQLAVFEESQEILDRLSDNLAQQKRDGILERANTVFKTLTAGERGYDGFEFMADDSYGFQLVRDDGVRPDMDEISKGEKHVVALSFIMGLARYADRAAPLVMDTPIARLDMEYRKRFASLLASLDQQVILFVTDATLVGGIQQLLADDIATHWELTHETDAYAPTIRRLDQ